MSGSLDQALIRQLFDELSAALEARGVRGHVYLIGGGAMITGYGRNRTTKDIDVRIDEAKDEVLAAAVAIGARHGLDERWLDLGVAQFVPRGDDVRAKTIHNSPGLLVTGASAEHLLAMKVVFSTCAHKSLSPGWSVVESASGASWLGCAMAAALSVRPGGQLLGGFCCADGCRRSGACGSEPAFARWARSSQRENADGSPPPSAGPPTPERRV